MDKIAIRIRRLQSYNFNKVVNYLLCEIEQINRTIYINSGYIARVGCFLNYSIKYSIYRHIS